MVALQLEPPMPGFMLDSLKILLLETLLQSLMLQALRSKILIMQMSMTTQQKIIQEES